ncbi:TPA: hypothetical protein N0F65_006140, partial [Lagenidium giganteum]
DPTVLGGCASPTTPTPRPATAHVAVQVDEWQEINGTKKRRQRSCKCAACGDGNKRTYLCPLLAEAPTAIQSRALTFSTVTGRKALACRRASASRVHQLRSRGRSADDWPRTWRRQQSER